MKTFFLVLASVAFASVSSLSIQSAEVVGSEGREETRPAKEGSTINLKCNLQLSTNEEWESCQWIHVMQNQWDMSGKEKMVKCTGLQNSQGAPCTNHGGSHELDNYASRVKMDVGVSHCGITISNAHPNDTGRWECKVTAGSSYSGYLDLFVTQRAIVNISEPTAGNKIQYVFGYGRPEIRSTCRGYGGRPQPTFSWYVNEERYLIRNDISANPVRTGEDPVLGKYHEETISFTPSKERLCNDYGLNSFCLQDTYTFKLLCRVDQGIYYQSENSRAFSEALVEVRNGVEKMLGSIILIVSAIFLSSTGLLSRFHL